jgi:acyl carrier protein
VDAQLQSTYGSEMAGDRSIAARILAILGSCTRDCYRAVDRNMEVVALGLDSIELIAIVARIQMDLNVELPLATLVRSVSVQDLIELVEKRARMDRINI